jgi:7-cyano-7-deazaguanine tRNA-ribosyltransferase
MVSPIRRIRCIADYQFGAGCGSALFPEGVKIERSKKTGKIRHIRLGGLLLASLRASDSFFALTIAGAERLVSRMDHIDFTLVVSETAEDSISRGGNAFAKHVVDAGKSIRPGDEVIMLNRKGCVLAVGRAILNREEMLSFDTGVAAKTRRGKEKSVGAANLQT